MTRKFQAGVALRVVWASLMVVFTAYIAVALGLGGSVLLDAFSSWVASRSCSARPGCSRAGLPGDGRRAPWLAFAAERGAVGRGRADLRDRLLRRPGPRPLPVGGGRALARGLLATARGIVLVLRARLRRAFHPTMWLDAAIGATTIAALTATIAFDPVLADTGGGTLQAATDLAYPLADLELPTRSSSRCSR